MPDNGLMHKNRITSLRQTRNLTLEELGDQIGLSKSAVSRLESGETKLNIDMAYKVARALDASVEEVLGIEATAPGFSEDGQIYQPDNADPLKSFTGPNMYIYTVTTNALDLADIRPGDKIVIDDRAEACMSVDKLHIVAVQYSPTDKGKSVFLLRQFVPPRLLITNSSKSNLRSIDMGAERATIVGVVKHVLRSFR